jgi:hypothetical protein
VTRQDSFPHEFDLSDRLIALLFERSPNKDSFTLTWAKTEVNTAETLFTLLARYFHGWFTLQFNCLVPGLSFA